MSEQVQELINKIKSDGIQEAERRAREIEEKARQDAEHIIQDAESRAKKLVADAEQECQQKRESTQMALRQASRDLILDVNRNVNQQLKAIVSADVRQSLNPEELSALIGKVIEKYMDMNDVANDVVIGLSEEDARKLGDSFLAKLKGRLQQPVSFRSSGDIDAGFTISFDQGKSAFDFSDNSLVDYLCTFLNQEISSLLQDAVSSTE